MEITYLDETSKGCIFFFWKRKVYDWLILVYDLFLIQA